jgi:Arabinogalactan endo-1,4-beta-galactosidase
MDLRVSFALLFLLVVATHASLNPRTATTSLFQTQHGNTFFMRGAAMGSLPQYDCNGTCSKYRANATAPPQDALRILSDHGLNTVRLRLFGPQVCAENTYAGIDSVLAMARRARSAGLAITLDVFYTQWVWACADPPPAGVSAKDYQRRTPAEWKDLGFAALLQATANYTHTAVSRLVEQGTPPQSVQIGNEINCGLFHPWPGQTCADGGEVCACKDNWHNLAAIVRRRPRP